MREDTSQQLRRITQLRDWGVLSNREFKRERRQVLRAGDSCSDLATAGKAKAGLLVLATVVIGVGLILGLTSKPSPGSKSEEVSLTSASPTEGSAVKWAESQVGHTAFNGVSWADLCLTFVYDAYKYGAGASLQTRTKNVSYNSNTDPQIVWGNGNNFTSGTWQATSNPSSIPYGALVFFDATPPHDPEFYSHVAIMDSNGTMIMTPSSTGQAVFRQTFAQRAAARPWNNMVGWWLPDGSHSPAPPATVPQPTPKAPVGNSTAGSSASTSPGAAPTSTPSSAGTAAIPVSPTQSTTGPQAAGTSGSTPVSQSGGTQSGPPTGNASGSSSSSPSTASQDPSSPSTAGEPSSTAPTSATSTSQPPQTYSETVGGISHTWSDYADAGGTEGPSIASLQTIQIACKLTGFKVADGNTWWYQIASSPWSNQYYVSADAFYNNTETSGTLIGTPFVDANVPNC